MPQTAEITFTDKFGDERKITRNANGLHLTRPRETVVQKLGQELSVLTGARIRTHRVVRGMTLADLCIRAGLVSATPKERMWRIENAKRREGVTLGTLYAIALALDVEMSDLLPSLAEIKDVAGLEKRTVVSVAAR